MTTSLSVNSCNSCETTKKEVVITDKEKDKKELLQKNMEEEKKKYRIKVGTLVKNILYPMKDVIINFIRSDNNKVIDSIKINKRYLLQSTSHIFNKISENDDNVNSVDIVIDQNIKDNKDNKDKKDNKDSEDITKYKLFFTIIKKNDTDYSEFKISDIYCITKLAIKFQFFDLKESLMKVLIGVDDNALIELCNNICTCLKTISESKKNEEVDIDEGENTKIDELLLSMLRSRMFLSKINKSTTVMNIDLIRYLLKTNDYEQTYSHDDDKLETNIAFALLNTLSEEYKTNKNQDICETLVKEFWPLLKHDAIDMDFFKKLYLTKVYHIPNVTQYLAPSIIKCLFSLERGLLYTHAILPKQRWQIKKDLEELKSYMTLEEINNLKVGDKLDAKDSEKKWYVAEVVSNNERNVRVHFLGWNSSNDENLDKTDITKFAAYGKFTNKVEHRPPIRDINGAPTGEPCPCVACKSRQNNPTMFHNGGQMIDILRNFNGENIILSRQAGLMRPLQMTIPRSVIQPLVNQTMQQTNNVQTQPESMIQQTNNLNNTQPIALTVQQVLSPFGTIQNSDINMNGIINMFSRMMYNSSHESDDHIENENNSDESENID